jgi:hypothetical protein
MSDLQIALIAAAIAVVAGVWGYNKWQERQHRKLAEKIFRGEQPDVLLGAEAAAEPAADRGAASVATPVERVEPAERREPMVAPKREEADAPVPVDSPAEVADAPPLPLPPLPSQWADDIADCLVRVDFAEPVAAPGLWAAQSRWAGQIGKTLSWLGFDEAAGRWQRLSAEDARRYLVVVAALQLADRRGAASDAELATFLDGVRDLAAQCGGAVDLPKHDAVLMHARGLDEFCASVDLQLGVNIVAAPAAPFAGTKLRGLAEAAGLGLRSDGCFHASDEVGHTRFTLGNVGPERFEAESLRSLATHGVTLSLDVPRVADGPAVFDALLGVARQLTLSLDGRLVDAQGNALSAEMIAAIRAKVGELQQKMALHQILAGSDRALRLFA